MLGRSHVQCTIQCDRRDERDKPTGDLLPARSDAIASWLGITPYLHCSDFLRIFRRPLIVLITICSDVQLVVQHCMLYTVQQIGNSGSGVLTWWATVGWHVRDKAVTRGARVQVLTRVGTDKNVYNQQQSRHCSRLSALELRLLQLAPRIVVDEKDAH